ATWLVANVAQQKETQLIEKMQQQSTNIIKIVSRKVDSHFFNASEDITVEIDHPLLNALLTTESVGQPANQFVIHNDIAYGPVPNFNSIGVARIETSLLLTEAQ